MIEHYEGLLLSQQQETELWRGKFTTLESDLQSSSGSKQQLEDQVDGLKSELEKIKGDLKDQYDQNYQLQNELSGVQGRLHESESSADALNNQLIELRAKYNAITKLRDSELARSASKARKEVKGRGMELIQGAIRFIQTEKVKSDLESDIKEHESNLILLDQIHDDDFSEAKERSELASSLSEKKNRLAALPASSFNPQDFAEFFTESPPLSESGLDWAGSSETEGIVSPEVPAAPKVTSGDVCTEGNEQGISSDQVPAKEVVDKHRRLCDERQRLGLKRQTLEARIARVERKVRALESDPFQWEWRNFDCIAEIPRMLRMYLRAKGQVRGPVNAPTEAALVDSDEEDEENDDNPWKRVPNEPEVKGGNGASTSNSTSAMREPDRVENINLSANHSIPRMEFAAYQGHDVPINCSLNFPLLLTILLTPADMDFNLRCSESMPDFSRVGMIDEDVPSRRSPPPRGFFRSQIRAPCALIRNLPIRDQGTAMAFIETLALQHRKLTLEKKRLRKRINRMQRRLTTVSRDLHILGSHPGDWIELGISDFARIPDCMMPVLDLAGQGVQVFCSPGGFS
ncbi:hypothetical protein ISN45_Aa06g026860 [Arabidopsis thaliana x Arabidopsis arenosa]|uniref:Uncharacterized protein n=1 Tax=Arabidopsis thaliana x Arabidopsis arenosa TaxID=1240361 RepID=A0A8T1Z0B8_9BRAS|nr:hypothetical protein ISN45_Aa06g026860 [Arabidopsis thaliana x Arabidopsis arenosa]